MAEVILESIGKSYGSHSVLSDLNLTVEDGEFAVLVGPSGCGKSTTLQLISGLEMVTQGRIVINGVDVTSLEPKERDIAMVFQSYALFPHMSVRDNIAFGPRLRDNSRAEINRQVTDVAERLQITDHLDRLPKALSGGQRQRVALARALVRRPVVFLMDEPLSNLDAKLRIEARSFLAKMHRELGITTIYVTHDQSEAMTMGSRIVVMNQGRIEQAAPPLEVYDRPANRFVADFIGSPAMNFFEAICEDGRLLCSAGTFNVPVPAHYGRVGNGRVTLGLRPEHLRLLPGAANPSHAAIPFKVDVVQHLGHEILLDLRAGPHHAIARAGPEESVQAGQTRTFVMDLERAHLFDVATGECLPRQVASLSDNRRITMGVE